MNTFQPSWYVFSIVYHRHYRDRSEGQVVMSWVAGVCIGEFLDYLERQVHLQHSELDGLTRRALRMRPKDDAAFNNGTACN